MLNKLHTDNAPAAVGPYSQAMEWNNLIFTSGMLGLVPTTGEMAGLDVAAQATQIMKNLDALLTEAGSGFDCVLKTSCFLADMGDFGVFNDIYAQYFTGKPARSCVAVKQLPKNAMVEVEVIAVKR